MAGSGFAAFGAGFFGGANRLYDYNREREDEFVKRYDEQFRAAKQMYMERLLKLQDEDAKVDAYTPLVGGDANAAKVAVRSGMSADQASRLQDRAVAANAMGMVAPTLGNPTGQPTPQAKPGQAPGAIIPTGGTPTPPPSAVTPGMTPAQAAVPSQAPDQSQDQSQQTPQPQSVQPQAQAQPQPQPQQAPQATPQAQPQPHQMPFPVAPQQQPMSVRQKIGSLLTGYHSPSQLAGRAALYESNVSGLPVPDVQKVMSGAMPQRTPVAQGQSYIIGPERIDLPKMIQQMIVEGHSKDPQKAIMDLRNNDIMGAASTIPTFMDQTNAKIQVAIAGKDHAGLLNAAVSAAKSFYGTTNPLGQFQLFNQDDAALAAATQVRALQYAEQNNRAPGEAAQLAYIDVRSEHIADKLVRTPAGPDPKANAAAATKLLETEITQIGDPQLQQAVRQRVISLLQSRRSPPKQ